MQPIKQVLAISAVAFASSAFAGTISALPDTVSFFLSGTPMAISSEYYVPNGDEYTLCMYPASNNICGTTGTPITSTWQWGYAFGQATTRFENWNNHPTFTEGSQTVPPRQCPAFVKAATGAPQTAYWIAGESVIPTSPLAGAQYWQYDGKVVGYFGNNLSASTIQAGVTFSQQLGAPNHTGLFL
jgi:hypothetical protein